MNESNALKTDLYQLTMIAGYEAEGKNQQLATFELFVRKLPQSRNYLLASGINEALQALIEMRFTEKQIDYVKSLPSFKHAPASFFDTLRKFKFDGDVWAVKEGTPVFGNEPMLAVRAPLCQSQLLETYLLNVVGASTMFASKASRIVDAAAPAGVMEFGTRRSHNPEAAIACARAAYIAGCIGTSNVEAGFRHGVPLMGTMAHSFVMSFDSELDAFRAYARTFPKNSVFLVDTYDIEQGIKNAITVAKEMEKAGNRLFGIRIDSDDLAKWSKIARVMMDKEGLQYVGVTLSNDLDENSITQLRSNGARFESVGVGTMLATSKDAPNLGVVYKLCEIEVNGQMEPRIKVSEGKTTLPGLKQVYRFMGEDGKFSHDEICLANEQRAGAEPLLSKVVENGKLTASLPSLEQLRNYTREQKDRIPANMRGLLQEAYSVVPSNKLAMLQTVLIQESREKKSFVENGNTTVSGKTPPRKATIRG